MLGFGLLLLSAFFAGVAVERWRWISRPKIEITTSNGQNYDAIVISGKGDLSL